MAKIPGAAMQASGAIGADPEEVARFERVAREWWDPAGKFKPLHKLNPVRLRFIEANLCRHFGRGAGGARPFTGLSILDIGCGGGLIAEPLARAGATVTGIDAGAETVAIAARHAAEAGLDIRYRQALAEDLVKEGATFDAVLALEVVEHVPDIDAFIAATATLAKPGGMIIAATLNRTIKSYMLAIVGAEYVLGWLPKGTHDWKKFVRPSELARAFRRGGVEIKELAGVGYNPLGDRWQIVSDLDVNYMTAATKPPIG
jgi:2-polyprenyl-6-hydroxyphenyl methylase / 3-demethylubiquinone-9 3-methyltransferase